MPNSAPVPRGQEEGGPVAEYLFVCHNGRYNVGHGVRTCCVVRNVACWLRCFVATRHTPTSRDTCDVVLIAKPSPSQQRSAVVEYPIATRTPRTNHQVKRPARCQWHTGHVVHVPCGALQANDDGIRSATADPFRERKIDKPHTSLS